MSGARIELRDKSCVLEIRAVNRWLQFKAVNFRVIIERVHLCTSRVDILYRF